jgi:hypothetical protein
LKNLKNSVIPNDEKTNNDDIKNLNNKDNDDNNNDKGFNNEVNYWPVKDDKDGESGCYIWQSKCIIIDV